jgi:hypothetical protein
MPNANIRDERVPLPVELRETVSGKTRVEDGRPGGSDVESFTARAPGGQGRRARVVTVDGDVALPVPTIPRSGHA